MSSRPRGHGELVIFPFSRRLASTLGLAPNRPRRPWGKPAPCSKRECGEPTTVMVRIENSWTARCPLHLPRPAVRRRTGGPRR